MAFNRNNPLYKWFTKEDHFATAVATYIRSQYPGLNWWHTPNESKRTPLQQLKIVSLGVRAGVSDIIIISNKIGEKGLVMELKIKPNILTAEQSKFVNDMMACGWDIAIEYNLNGAMQTIDNYVRTKTNYQIR